MKPAFPFIAVFSLLSLVFSSLSLSFLAPSLAQNYEAFKSQADFSFLKKNYAALRIQRYAFLDEKDQSRHWKGNLEERPETFLVKGVQIPLFHGAYSEISDVPSCQSVWAETLWDIHYYDSLSDFKNAHPLVEGSYPASEEEIVISSFHYDYLLSSKRISSFQELSEKTFADIHYGNGNGSYRISGVYSSDDALMGTESFASLFYSQSDRSLLVGRYEPLSLRKATSKDRFEKYIPTSALAYDEMEGYIIHPLFQKTIGNEDFPFRSEAEKEIAKDHLIGLVFFSLSALTSMFALAFAEIFLHKRLLAMLSMGERKRLGPLSCLVVGLLVGIIPEGIGASFIGLGLANANLAISGSYYSIAVVDAFVFEPMVLAYLGALLALTVLASLWIAMIVGLKKTNDKRNENR